MSPIRPIPDYLLAGAKHLLQDFLPPYCLVCRQGCTQLTPLCIHCLDQVDLNLYPCPRCALPLGKMRSGCKCASQRTFLDSLSVPLLYTDVLRQLIYQWKFRGRVELTQPLVNLACQEKTPVSIEGRTDPVDLVVPVGMHWRARLKRGFNQSHLLALALSSTLACPTKPPVKALLKAASRSTSQHALSRTDRLENALQQFSVKQDLKSHRILLVDDVMTTGATMENAAWALREAGARRVHGWCLARSIEPGGAGV